MNSWRARITIAAAIVMARRIRLIAITVRLPSVHGERVLNARVDRGVLTHMSCGTTRRLQDIVRRVLTMIVGLVRESSGRLGLSVNPGMAPIGTFVTLLPLIRCSCGSEAIGPKNLPLIFGGGLGRALSVTRISDRTWRHLNNRARKTRVRAALGVVRWPSRQ